MDQIVSGNGPRLLTSSQLEKMRSNLMSLDSFPVRDLHSDLIREQVAIRGGPGSYYIILGERVQVYSPKLSGDFSNIP